MATKSILKNVDIKDKKLAKSLITALENAKGKKAKDVDSSSFRVGNKALLYIDIYFG